MESSRRTNKTVKVIFITINSIFLVVWLNLYFFLLFSSHICRSKDSFRRGICLFVFRLQIFVRSVVRSFVCLFVRSFVLFISLLTFSLSHFRANAQTIGATSLFSLSLVPSRNFHFPSIFLCVTNKNNRVREKPNKD